MSNKRFSKGSEVVLVHPRKDDMYVGQWNELMNLYVGRVGVITSVLSDSTFSYRVEFDPPIYVDGEPTRNFWYLRDDWCELVEFTGSYDDLDCFISEFCHER